MATLCQIFEAETRGIKSLKPSTKMGVGRPVYSMHQLYMFMMLSLVYRNRNFCCRYPTLCAVAIAILPLLAMTLLSLSRF